jgi:O-antigen/teichoic acid export membrane protein
LSDLPTNLENMFWWCITINLMLLMTALVQLFYYSKKDNDERTFPDRPKSLFRFFRDRIPYGLHELQSALYMNAIILVLGFIVTNDQLATYRALQLIFVPIGIVPIIMSQVLLKVLSERVAESQFVVKTFNRFLIVSVVISVCFILLLVSYGKQLIGLMYSNEYQDSPFLLELIVVFSVSHLFRFVSANYGVLITAYGKQRIRAYATFLLVLTTVVGCILFVDRYGLVGAAYASALSYLCLMVVYSGYAEIFLLKRNNLC